MRQYNTVHPINLTIENVCNDCGLEANRLTCLAEYGHEPIMPKFSQSTYHRGRCDFCHKVKSITEVRDFFYPDFSLLPIKGS